MYRNSLFLALASIVLACGPANTAEVPNNVETQAARAEVVVPSPPATEVVPVSQDAMSRNSASPAQAAAAKAEAKRKGNTEEGTPSASRADAQQSDQAMQPSPTPAQAPASAKASAKVQKPTSATPEPTKSSSAPSHAAFSSLLKKHVDSRGDVDYAALKKDEAKLESYLQTLSNNAPAGDWSRNEKLAYWINAYNAATLDLILDNYPLQSITKLDGGKPWDVKRVKLGGKTYSLNQIENEIIRPRFNEPRIHFAVNCAAASCPPLRNEAFVASRLDEQLEEQTRKFLNNARYTKVEGNTLKVSKIFDWYGEDFADVQRFVGNYRDVPSEAELEYLEYDWALNKQ